MGIAQGSLTLTGVSFRAPVDTSGLTGFSSILFTEHQKIRHRHGLQHLN